MDDPNYKKRALGDDGKKSRVRDAEIADLRLQIENLQRQNQAKDELISELEENVQAKDERISDLEEEVTRQRKRFVLEGKEYDVWKTLPPDWKQDQDFVRELIEKGRIKWATLPHRLQYNIEYIRSLTKLHGYQVERLFELQPSLKDDRNFWMENVGKMSSWAYSLINRNMPQSILSDYKVMLEACSTDCRVFEMVSDTFGRNREFLEAVLNSKPFSLGSVSREAQLMFPDLVVATFDLLGQKETQYWSITAVFNNIPRELWNEDMAKQWLEAGLPLIEAKEDAPSHKFPERFKNDGDLLLRSFEKSRKEDWVIKSVRRASADLRRNRSFMQRTIALAPASYACVHPNLGRDLDLALPGFSQSIQVVYDWYHSSVDEFRPRHRTWIQSVPQSLQAMIDEYDAFVVTVLGGMSWGTNPGSTLSILDQGDETSIQYKMRIADFLGIPTGKKLAQVRSALFNVKEILPQLRD